MKSLLLLLLLLLTLLPTTYAQPAGVVHGVVTDESGALVPGAKVTVSNAAGPVKSAIAGNDGAYSVAGLDAGTYTVQATLPGFQQMKPASVDLAGGTQTATLDLQLTVAAEKQEVTVQENAGPASERGPFPKRGRPGAARSRFAGAVGRSGRSAGRFAGAGGTIRRTRAAARSTSMALPAASCRAKIPSARSASTRIPFRRNTTSWATGASRSSPSPAPTSCTET